MTGTSPARELDIIVYGASGFVGKLLADYLVKHAPEGTKIGLGGRSLEKLAATRADLGTAAADLPLIIADADDATALKALAQRTRVVATTVGPYAKYGHALVHECASAGTHYVDLTGEVLFHRESIDANHALAVSTGAKIVHSCGFDSIPSDLGVHVLHEKVAADGAGELTDTTLVVTGPARRRERWHHRFASQPDRRVERRCAPAETCCLAVLAEPRS
ncbi:enoyl-ACP reductase [Rhodococcus erythropolis]|uniref:Enoyl-ACP reductase n=1 Tax=Rhodococcus erythropolis TaxID=1833 RepID=A0A6G9CUN8_RHOER|nr:enoyl-ACP reductase [Rhodococcus erythropolis]